MIEDDRLFNLLYAEIDAGEAEALVLALEQNADLLLLDDQEARSMARKLGLPITGTIGVLLKAKNEKSRGQAWLIGLLSGGVRLGFIVVVGRLSIGCWVCRAF